MWCIPPTEDSHFVANMEDVLAVYARPYDKEKPVICIDESSKQILSEKQPPLQAYPAQEGRAGQVERPDYEYVREGTCALFMVFEPLAAQRHVQVSAQRTCSDFARVMQWVCDELYPDARSVVVVVDNLNTHGPHSLYKALAPAQARRLCERIEWHYTPKHGSWLNMAELELSVLARQCLNDRMGSMEHLRCQVQAWQERRNSTSTRVQWHFTTEDARRKLHRLYPKLLPG